METAKITFIDGTELETEHNGACFITDTKTDFPDDLSEVTITITSEIEIPQKIEYDEEGNEIPKEPQYEKNTETEVLRNVSVQECASIDGRYWFTFLSVSDEELKVMKNEAQVFYTAMMTDTLLEEE